MRILQVVQALPPHTYGGSELYTATLAETLESRGHDVAIATPHGGETVDVRTIDLPAPQAPDVQSDAGLPTGPVSPAVDERMDEVLTSFDPDVVHLQHFKGLSVTIPARCAEHDVTCVATLHDFWTICHREQLYRPDGERCRGPDSVAKCTDCYLAAVGDPQAVDIDDHRTGEVSPEFGPPAHRAEGSEPPAAEPAKPGDAVREQYRTVVEQRGTHIDRALEETDRIVAPSTFLRDRIVAYAADPQDVMQIRNGIRAEKFDDTGFDGPPVSIGYAGRLAPVKGVHLLVEAFTDVDGEATLDMFGQFVPEEESYHAHLADLAGERVKFHGWYDDPGAPYREMDVFVLPSVWYENSPLVLQEANAAGLPTVVANVGGMAELVTDGEDGLTFAVGDVDSLADQLRSLVSEPARVDRLRRGVDDPTHLDDHVVDIERVYADCLLS